jgi:hypothetical protein
MDDQPAAAIRDALRALKGISEALHELAGPDDRPAAPASQKVQTAPQYRALVEAGKAARQRRHAQVLRRDASLTRAWLERNPDPSRPADSAARDNGDSAVPPQDRKKARGWGPPAPAVSAAEYKAAAEAAGGAPPRWGDTSPDAYQAPLYTVRVWSDNAPDNTRADSQPRNPFAVWANQLKLRTTRSVPNLRDPGPGPGPGSGSRPATGQEQAQGQGQRQGRAKGRSPGAR